MYTTTSELDEAFDRIGSAAFEYANGFINHGAMAVEALSSLVPANQARRRRVRMHAVGGMDLVSAQVDGQAASVVVMDVPAMAHFLG